MIRRSDMNINHNVIAELAEEFLGAARDLAANDLATSKTFDALFNGITLEQCTDGLEAFTSAVALYKRLGEIRQDVAEAMFGPAGLGAPGHPSLAELGLSKIDDREDYVARYWAQLELATGAPDPEHAMVEAMKPFANDLAKASIQFIDAVTNFDHLITQTVFEEVTEDEVTHARQFTKLVFGSRSRLVRALLDSDAETATMALSAVPFPSYGPDGYTADGDSILLGTAEKASKPGELAINAVNAMQMAPLTLNDSIEMAAKVLNVIADNLEGVEKAVAKRLKARAKKAGVSQFEAVDLNTFEIFGAAESTAFIVENGEAYLRYKLDGRGRQYQLGAFSQLSPVGVLLVMDNPDAAIKKLTKAGVDDYAKLCDAVGKLIDGDLSALSEFYDMEVKRRRDGEKYAQFTFKPALLAAALVIKSNKEVADVKTAA